MNSVLFGRVPPLYAEVAKAIQDAVFTAIDRKGYVPCSMATATQNATITLIMGVECYSKTDVCRTYPIPAGATTANHPMQGDASRSEERRQSVGMTQRGAR